MATVYEIIQGLSQAAANAYDGALDENGEALKPGLQRDEGRPLIDKRVMDGFNVTFYGNKMCLGYHSEVHLREVYANGFEQEIEFLGGSRDGSREGIFDIFREFEYDFQLIQEYIEIGADYPEAFEGDPDGHPEEDWQVFRGRVQMLMLDENGDGFRVDQIMTYKLRLADNGLWKIVRWIDDPLSGDCGAGKPTTNRSNWSNVKITANK